MAKWRKKPVIIDAVQLTRKITISTPEGERVLQVRAHQDMLAQDRHRRLRCRLQILRRTWRYLQVKTTTRHGRVASGGPNEGALGRLASADSKEDENP